MWVVANGENNFFASKYVKTTMRSGFFILKKELLCNHELGQLYKKLSIVFEN